LLAGWVVVLKWVMVSEVDEFMGWGIKEQSDPYVNN
jgi:hypothetical protein